MMQRLLAWRRSLADPRSLYVLTLLLSFVARVLAGRAASYFGGDWLMYSRVADNILRGCGVSASDLATPHCAPHFGGNGLPGYPWFLAALWWLFGRSQTVVIIAHAAIGAMANVWLTRAVLVWSRSRVAAVICALLLSVSPVQLVWAGAGLTEALAIAATAWILAELLLSLAEKRLRSVGLALALAAAAFLRLDSVALIAPIALTAVMVHSPGQALKRLVLVGAIVALPLGLWTARNLVEGVNVLPAFGIQPDGSAGPKGYLSWVYSWAVDEKQRAHAIFYADKDYARISFPPDAYVDSHERAQVAVLLDELRHATGKPFPLRVDAEFARLAQNRLGREPWFAKVARPFERAFWLWSSWLSPLIGALGLTPIKVTATAYYRSGLLFAYAGLVAYAFMARRRDLQDFVVLAAVFFLARTILLVSVFAVEYRFLVEMAPIFEVAAALLAAQWLRALSRPATPRCTGECQP